MSLTTFKGQTVLFCGYHPNWARRVSLSAEVPVDIEVGLTGREYRTPVDSTLRCKLSWKAAFSASDFAMLRDDLRSAGSAKAIVPAWPFLCPGNQFDVQTDVSGGIWVGMNSNGTFTIGEAEDFDPADWEWFAPGLYGVLTVDDPGVISNDLVEVGFTCQEDGPGEYALAAPSQTWTEGPTLSDGKKPYVLPWILDTSSVKGGAPEAQIERKAFGGSRETSAAFYPQNASRAISGRLPAIFGREDVAILMRWFQDHGGHEPHYVTTAIEAARLSQNAASGQNTMVLTDGAGLGSYRYLHLIDHSSQSVVRISSINVNTATLTANLSKTWLASSTAIALASLARHTGELQIDFGAPALAFASLAWQEVPEEYVPDGDETRGETLGAGPLTAWLYQFTLDECGTQTVYRYTGFSLSLTASGETWAAQPIEHGELRADIDLSTDEVTVKCRMLPVFEQFLPGNLTGRVLLSIYTCEVTGSAGSNVTQIWTGEVRSASFDGPFVQATASGPYAIFDQPLPRRCVQPQCTHRLFDGLCGLAQADWTITGDVVSSSGHSVTLGTFARTGGLPDGFGFANWFALGYLERSTGERIAILSSTAISSGELSLTLEREPSTDWDNDESVDIIPGCDGMAATCEAYASPANPTGKFDNFANFGGFPLVPAKNPSFKPPKRTDATTGKK